MRENMEAGSELRPDATVAGGDLDCGSGLLLILRDALEPLPEGGVLELVSREVSVKEDLPAWCRMVGHSILDVRAGEGRDLHYFLRKKGRDESLGADLEKARGYRWQVRASWSGGMKTRVYARNHAWEIGQPASFETRDEAPAAIEALLGALAGCLVSGLAWRASRRAMELRGMELSLSARSVDILAFLGIEKARLGIEKTGHPGLEGVEGRLYLEAGAPGEELEALWRETLEGSPVAQTLLRGAPLAVEMRRIG